jgi:hypothetical protein
MKQLIDITVNTLVSMIFLHQLGDHTELPIHQGEVTELYESKFRFSMDDLTSYSYSHS